MYKSKIYFAFLRFKRLSIVNINSLILECECLAGNQSPQVQCILKHEIKHALKSNQHFDALMLFTQKFVMFDYNTLLLFSFYH